VAPDHFAHTVDSERATGQAQDLGVRIGERLTKRPEEYLAVRESRRELTPPNDSFDHFRDQIQAALDGGRIELIERMLVALAGVETAFYVRAAGERLPVVPDSRGTEADRTMAVQYVKFPLSIAAKAALATGNVELSLGVEHEAYRAEVVLSRDTRQSLVDDFA